MIKRFNKKGFSLVELLVVITIIAILSVVAYSAVAGNTVKARDAKRKQDLTTMQQAFEIYFVQNAKYPAQPLKSGTNIGAGEIPKSVLSDISVDPGTAKHNYQYIVSGTTYQLAATLENDGQLGNYETYIVGNSDAGLLTTTGGFGRYYNGTVLVACTNGKSIISGKIGNADDHNKCIPYDPLN